MAAGRIRGSDIDELRERADIVEVISEHVQLKKAGRRLVGLCPFHDEKTPSFSVDPTKQFYHCFGCGEGGNIYSFLMKKEGLEFREAVERLAQRVGFRLHYEGVDPERRRQEGRRERLVRLHRFAADAYAAYLRSAGGSQARRYLEARGMEEAAWTEFGLGYAPPQWDFLYRQAVQNGFSPQEVGESGLFIRGEKGVFDRFRARVIFPIESPGGEVIGLGGRLIDRGEPKYMNSPETSIYVKSRNLYSLNRARREILKAGFAVIVEGYTDVIFLWQAGVRNAVATLGTALGEDHFRLLSRLTERVVLAFDADSAGLDASERGLAYFDRFNLDFRVLRLPEGKDPADYVKEAGYDGFMRLVEESRGIVEFGLEKALAPFDPTDLASRQKGIAKSIDLLLSLNVELTADLLLKKIADWAGTDVRVVHDYYNRTRREGAERGGGGRKGLERPGTAELDADARAERGLLGLMLQNPQVIDDYYTWLDEELFVQPVNRQIVRAMTGMCDEGRGVEEAGGEERYLHELVGKLQSQEARSLAISLMFKDEAAVEEGDERLRLQLRELFARLKDFYLERQIRDLKKELEGLTSRKERDHAAEAGVSREIHELELLRQDNRKDR